MRLKFGKIQLIAMTMLGFAATLEGSVATSCAQENANANQPAATQGEGTPGEGIAGNQLQPGLALNHLLNAFDLYHYDQEIQGAATLSGSMTMLNLGAKWAERYSSFHPGVAFTRGPDGTEKSLQALEKDASLIVGSSRPISPEEIARLKAGACKDPLSVIVALDPLAIYVHESNPIQAISPEQLEGILRAAGQPGNHYGTWGELGVQGDIAKKPIQFHSRSEQSGTKAFLKQFILRGAQVTKEVQSYRSNAEICNAIAADPAGFGICGFGDVQPGVRAVPLSLRGQIVPASEDSFLAGRYPLVRPLVLVFDRDQMKTDGGVRESMLRYILSRDGQTEAVKAGFYPLDPSFVHKQLDDICGPRMR